MSLLRLDSSFSADRPATFLADVRRYLDLGRAAPRGDLLATEPQVCNSPGGSRTTSAAYRAAPEVPKGGISGPTCSS